MRSAISRPIPRAAPVTTATLSVSSMASPFLACARARSRVARRPPRGSRPDYASTPPPAAGSAAGGLEQGGGELRAEDEDDPRVVGEHAERHEGAERPVDPVVDAHRQDVP